MRHQTPRRRRDHAAPYEKGIWAASIDFGTLRTGEVSDEPYVTPGTSVLVAPGIGFGMALAQGMAMARLGAG